MKPIEPFGYFKAEPFGWTDCAETDEGAQPLYERSDIVALDEELINEVEQVALALDAMFSYERGLDQYIDALNAVVRKAKGDSE